MGKGAQSPGRDARDGRLRGSRLRLALALASVLALAFAVARILERRGGDAGARGIASSATEIPTDRPEPGPAGAGAAGGAALASGDDARERAPLPPPPAPARPAKGSEVRSGSSSGSTSAHSTRAAESSGPPESAPNPATPGVRLAEAIVFTGTVRNQAHQPLAGIVVSAQPSLEGPERATTGADGRFEIRGDLGTWLVFDDPSGEHLGASLPGGTDLDVVLRRAARVVVRVVETGSRTPLPGALVSVLGSGLSRSAGPWADVPAEAVAGEDGVAMLAAPPGRFEVVATLAGYAEGSAAGEARVGEPIEVEIALGRGVTVRGRIVDAGGRPVAGAIVADVTSDVARLGNMPAEGVVAGYAEEVAANTRGEAASSAGASESIGLVHGRSGPDGAYELARVPPGPRWIGAAHAGHAPAARLVDIPEPAVRAGGGGELGGGAEVRVDLALGAAGTIAGTVTGGDGQPRAGVQVQAFSPTGGSRGGGTGPEGRYTIEGLAPGSYIVFVEPEAGAAADPGALAVQMKATEVRAGAIATVDFGGEVAGAVVRGRVRTAAGQVPGVGARTQGVALIGRGRGMEGMRLGGIAPDGSFEVTGVAPGAWLLLINPTYLREVAVPEGQPVVEVDLVLPGLRLEGVVEGVDGAPHPGALVAARPAALRGDALFAEMEASATAGADGRFVIEDLDAQGYDLVATAREGEPGSATRSGASVGPGAAPVTLRLTAAGSVRVRVLGPDGRPARSVVVVAVDATGAERARAEALDGGEPVLHGLAAGTYDVQVVSLQYAFGLARVDFDGTSAEVDVGLAPGGALDLIVRDGAGRPVEGARVEIAFADGRAVPGDVLGGFFGRQATDAEGRLRRERLQAGRYAGVVRSADGRLAGRFEAEVRVAESTTVEVALQPAE